MTQINGSIDVSRMITRIMVSICLTVDGVAGRVGWLDGLMADEYGGRLVGGVITEPKRNQRCFFQPCGEGVRGGYLIEGVIWRKCCDSQVR